MPILLAFLINSFLTDAKNTVLFNEHYILNLPLYLITTNFIYVKPAILFKEHQFDWIKYNQ